MERQGGNMEISDRSISHRIEVPKAQSLLETNSFYINQTSQARTLQQTQTEADNATAGQQVLNEESKTNKGGNDLFGEYWNRVPLPTKAKTDSDGEIRISISSHRLKTDNATTQQTDGEVIYERSRPNERGIYHSFGMFSDQIHVRRPTEARRDSDTESGISVSSHQTMADSATPQQTRGVKFLQFLNRPCAILPEVSKPDRKIQLKEKVVFTVIVLLIFMVYCQMPLFGIKSFESVDRFYHMRVTIWGSNRGTLMEFGIMPIVESSGFLFVLNSFRIINLDGTLYHHVLLEGARRFLAVLLTVVITVLFIMTGMYGELDDIGVAILIGIQLFFAGLIILLLNDIMKKGYCLGTDISLLIVPNICATIIWKAFSPVTVYTDQGAESAAAFIFLLQCLSRKNDEVFNLRRAFLRQNLPNILNLLAIFFVVFFFIYLKKFRVELPMKSTKYKGQQSFHSINLLYTSITPLLLQSAFVSILYLFSQVLSTNLSENFFTSLLGVWADERSDGPPHSYPIGGLSYYLSPPKTSLQVIQDPVYVVVYTVFVVGSCALFSSIWINFTNMRAVDVAAELKNKNLVMRGHGEQAMLIELEEYIPRAAIVGGLCIGTLSVLGDFLGVIVSGTGVILAANIISDYVEIFLKRKKMQEPTDTMLF